MFPWCYSGSWTSCVFNNFSQEGTPSNYKNIFLRLMALRHSTVYWLWTLDPVAQDFCRKEECSIWKEKFVSSVANLVSTTHHNSQCTFLTSFFCVAFFFLMSWFIVQETWIMQWSHWKVSTKHARDSSSPLTMSFFIISFNFHMPPSPPWTSWQLRSTESSCSIPKGELTLAGANLWKQE